jgi:hypothetical protein
MSARSVLTGEFFVFVSMLVPVCAMHPEGDSPALENHSAVWKIMGSGRCIHRSFTVKCNRL